MLYINTRTGLVFDASSEIHGKEIEVFVEAEEVEAEPVEAEPEAEKPKTRGRKKNEDK